MVMLTNFSMIPCHHFQIHLSRIMRVSYTVKNVQKLDNGPCCCGLFIFVLVITQTFAFRICLC